MPTDYQGLRAASRRIRGPLREIAATCRRAQVRGVKTKLLRLLSFLGLILAALASLDLSGFTALLPPAHAGKALAAGLVVASLKDLVFAIGDVADDGKRNGSWVPLLAWLMLPLGLLALPSCMATTRTTTIYPDGRKVIEETTAPAPGSVETAGALATTAAEIATSRQVPVHRDK
jgi:hypothetical protein